MMLALDDLRQLLERICDAEALLTAVPMGGPHADQNLVQGTRRFESAIRYASAHGFGETSELMRDVMPILGRDITRGLDLLRCVRMSVRQELDAGTDAAGLPRFCTFVVPAPDPPRHSRSKSRRRRPCPCGSGKMYEKCCGDP